MSGQETDRAHPGFGAFAKAHRDFFLATGEEGWTPVAGYSGVEEKVLAGQFDHAARTGSVTRLARWAPGAFVAETVSHAFCEELLILSGTLSIGTPESETRRLDPGTFVCRPPGIEHGPFFSRDGCEMVEFSYYPPD